MALQAAVPESLLDDLDDLGSDDEALLDDDEDVAELGNSGAGGPAAGAKRSRAEAAVGGVTTEDLDALSDDDDDLAAAAASSKLELTADPELESQLSRLRGRAAGYRSVAHLRETARFRDHMARVSTSSAAGVAAIEGHLDEHPDYRLVVASNQASRWRAR